MEITTTPKNCRLCTSVYEGNYCPSCGQKYVDKRITVKDSLTQLFHMVLNFDRGLWPTAWHLITKPAQVIRTYLSGVTLLYTHPFRFLFIWLTIHIFIMVSTGITDDIQEKVSRDMLGNEMKREMLPMLQMINNYMHLLLTASMPFLALGSKWLFRSRKYNYAEHLVINTYAYGTAVLITIFMMPLYYASESFINIATILSFSITFLYVTYVYSSVFKGNVIINLLKSILIFIIWYIGVLILISLFVIPYTIYLVKQGAL